MPTWTQVYAPLADNLWLSAAVALIPIIFFFVALAVLRMKGYLAAIITVALAVLVAVLEYKMPVSMALAATGYGFLYGLWPISWIIVAAVFLYKLTVKTGQFEVIRSSVLSITADWDVNAVAVRTRAGVEDFDRKTAQRVVTTGCGQGTVFGNVMDGLQSVRLPDAGAARISQSRLRDILEVMRQQDSIHRKAGSVHGCALFRGSEKLMFIEDVGRHNAIDTIAGWMWMHGVEGGDKIFYTTGRLTSEMVMKSAQIGVPIIVSRNGVTAMGHEMATRLGMTLFGRASNRHFICYTGFERFDSEPEPQRAPVRVVSG